MVDLLKVALAEAGLYTERDRREIDSLVAARLFIDKLAAERLRRGLSQEEVAQRMGTSQGSVAKLEAHRHDPRLSTLVRYAAALDVDVPALMSVMGKLIADEEFAQAGAKRLVTLRARVYAGITEQWPALIDLDPMGAGRLVPVNLHGPTGQSQRMLVSVGNLRGALDRIHRRPSPSPSTVHASAPWLIQS